MCRTTTPWSLAEIIYADYGNCHILWNNAGVTSGGGGNPWDQEPNDWRWCFGVNVFGTSNGVLAFVPRMIAAGEPGVVVTTSSGDGGIAPVPYASVYASSKAAISCFTEALAHQFLAQKTMLRASIFYPSGRPLGDRTVGGATQPASRVCTGATTSPCTRNDLRGVQSSAGGCRQADRDHGPARARKVRCERGERRPFRDQSQPQGGRPALARSCGCHSKRGSAPFCPRRDRLKRGTYES